MGEVEAMIVGTVHQEVGCSWQDACDTWAAQNGGMEAGVHQVEASGVEEGPVEGDQCKKSDEAEQDDEQPEMGGLLVDGEEREYILELLMREVPSSQPTGASSPRVEVNALKGKRKRNLGKRLRKKLKLSRGAAIREPRKEEKASSSRNEERQAASNHPHDPKAKDRGLAGRERGKGGQTAALSPTSGGECSG